MAEAFRVGAMPCGMPRTAPEAQHAAADRAPAYRPRFRRFAHDAPGLSLVAEKYDASRKTPLRDFAIWKKAGKENNPPRFPKIRPAPSRSVGAAKIRRRPPLLQSPAHSLAAPTRRACDANPRAAQIRPSLLRKAEVAASLPAWPLGEIPGRSAPAQPPLAERLRRTTPPSAALGLPRPRKSLKHKMQMRVQHRGLVAAALHDLPAAPAYAQTLLPPVQRVCNAPGAFLHGGVRGKSLHNLTRNKQRIPSAFRRHEQGFAAHGFQHFLKRRFFVFGENMHIGGAQQRAIIVLVQPADKKEPLPQPLRERRAALPPEIARSFVAERQRRAARRTACQQCKRGLRAFGLRRATPPSCETPRARARFRGERTRAAPRARAKKTSYPQRAAAHAAAIAAARQNAPSAPRCAQSTDRSAAPDDSARRRARRGGRQHRRPARAARRNTRSRTPRETRGAQTAPDRRKT